MLLVLVTEVLLLQNSRRLVLVRDRIMKSLFTIAVALILATGSNIVLADSSAPPQIYVLSVHQIIGNAAMYEDTDPLPLMKVAKCESNFLPSAVGDHGKAKNIFQYHEQTFDDFSQKLMKRNLNYNSATDQALLTAFIFKNYPQLKDNWTCSRKTGVI